jgi:hypothetical protein
MTVRMSADRRRTAHHGQARAPAIGSRVGPLSLALQSAPQTQLAPDGSRLEAYGDHWAQCERAATDILVQARKGRAFSSLDTLIAR